MRGCLYTDLEKAIIDLEENVFKREINKKSYKKTLEVLSNNLQKIENFKKSVNERNISNYKSKKTLEDFSEALFNIASEDIDNEKQVEQLGSLIKILESVEDILVDELSMPTKQTTRLIRKLWKLGKMGKICNTETKMAGLKDLRLFRKQVLIACKDMDDLKGELTQADSKPWGIFANCGKTLEIAGGGDDRCDGQGTY